MLQIVTQCLKSLYKVCVSNSLLPQSLGIELCDDPTSIMLYPSGFGDVYKRGCKGREVAVKVLKTYVNSDPQNITRVSHICVPNSNNSLQLWP